MIKTRINNEYKDIIKIFCGGALQKEITKVWSREANTYVYESSIEYTGTLPITITADGNALLDYKIYGNTVQDGTPTPENPIMPIGCGEKTANLCDKNNINQGYYAYADGQYEVFGTWVNTHYIAIKGNTEYTAKFKTIYGESRWYGFVWFDSDKQYISTTNTQANPSGCELTAKSPANASFCVFNMCSRSTYEVLSPSGVVYCMLNLGSTALPYEPYGYKLPMTVSDGNAVQTVPIYLGEAETTRRIKKLVLTGKEGWRRTTNEKCYYINLANGCPNDYLKQLTTTSICSHYQSQNNTTSGSNEVNSGHFCFYIGGGFELYIGETTISSATDFKSYLAAQYAAGTPVIVWYVLAEPETGVINEPLMKIGDYADTLSMEQADVSIPTFAGTTVIDCDGTTKPSRMRIKYRR